MAKRTKTAKKLEQKAWNALIISLLIIIMLISTLIMIIEINKEEVLNELAINEASDILIQPQPSDIAVNDEGYQEWIEWQKSNVAVLLVTDGEKAARLVLPEGRTLELEMKTPINISVIGIEQGRVLVRVNDEKYMINEGGLHSYVEGDIKVFVTEIILR